jgi:2,4-dichlorophenol 6-monooxygenase
VWVEHQGEKIATHDVAAKGERVSTHDLAGKGRFTLFTGIGGDAWTDAAARVSERTGVEIAAYVIGPGREVIDTYDDWARAREVQESGCVLVRPDTHVAWRSMAMVDDPAAALSRVMDAVLGRDQAVATSGETSLTASA